MLNELSPPLSVYGFSAGAVPDTVEIGEGKFKEKMKVTPGEFRKGF